MSQLQTPQATDRAALETAVDRYLDALVRGEPADAGLAPDVVFAENDQVLGVGDAAWRTIDALGRYRHVFADPELGDVAVIANARESGMGVILVVRLKIVDGLATEVEQVVLRDPPGYEFYEEIGEPDPVWLEPVPLEQRQSREALQASMWMYFQTLERNDGAGIYPFRDDCERIEHGRRTVRTEDNDGYGHADLVVDFTSLEPKAQYELGLMAFVTRARDRRPLVTDVERAAVIGVSCFDFDGMLERIHFADGNEWTIPPYFRTPRTHHYTEAFKILAGEFRYVEMTLLEVPFATRPAWTRPMTVSLDYTPTFPPATPVSADRETLLALADGFLQALVRDSPHDLPLAQDVLYTENGVAVTLGEGLWRSTQGICEPKLSFADVETGQAGCLARLDENGEFAMVAARLALRDGRVSEIEVVAARPEPGGEWGDLDRATNTMFVAPLLADPDPAAFTELPEALTRPAAAPGARADLAAAADAYLDGVQARTPDAIPLAGEVTARENGVTATDNPAGPVVDPETPGYGIFAGDLATQVREGYRAALSSLRRSRRVVDEKSGLVLDLSVRDYPGDRASVDVPGVGAVACAESFRWPCSDLHATLLKLEDGRIAHVETLVRRVPYGQPIPGPGGEPA